eukprot:GHRR01002658.1.p1 GENE.GHRR01002658.1~~GHRR01002658.1.p1  ORF type:complete len:605 (+),score=267.69 GHRR01002658.1:628-2442(+)
MYNNIGVLTPRGTGTSGHVQANKFNLRRAPVPKFQEGQASAVAAADKKPNQAILEHNKKRQIELQVFQLREELEEKGVSEEEIKEAEEKKRAALVAEYEQQQLQDQDAKLSNETHAVAQRKQEQMEKMRKAFGLGEVVWGEAFDPEVQARKKHERIEQRQAEEKAAFEKREAARKEKEERQRRHEQGRQQREERAAAAAAAGQQHRLDRKQRSVYPDRHGPGSRAGDHSRSGMGHDRVYERYDGHSRDSRHCEWLPREEGYYRTGDAAPDRYNPDDSGPAAASIAAASIAAATHQVVHQQADKAVGKGKDQSKRKRRHSPSSSSSSGSSSGRSSSSSGTASSGSNSSGSDSRDSADRHAKRPRNQPEQQQELGYQRSRRQQDDWQAAAGADDKQNGRQAVQRPGGMDRPAREADRQEPRDYYDRSRLLQRRHESSHSADDSRRPDSRRDHQAEDKHRVECRGRDAGESDMRRPADGRHREWGGKRQDGARRADGDRYGSKSERGLDDRQGRGERGRFTDRPALAERAPSQYDRPDDGRNGLRRSGEGEQQRKRSPSPSGGSSSGGGGSSGGSSSSGSSGSSSSGSSGSSSRSSGESDSRGRGMR